MRKKHITKIAVYMMILKKIAKKQKLYKKSVHWRRSILTKTSHTDQSGYIWNITKFQLYHKSMFWTRRLLETFKIVNFRGFRVCFLSKLTITLFSFMLHQQFRVFKIDFAHSEFSNKIGNKYRQAEFYKKQISVVVSKVKRRK